MMLRYVVLTHDHPEWHWDFMLESNGVLRTWRLGQNPALLLDIEATPLPDHRLHYLAYEGPVSGGRGNVQRWDQGVYHVIQEGDGVLCVALLGDKLRGQVTLITSIQKSTGPATCYRFTPTAESAGSSA